VYKKENPHEKDLACLCARLHQPACPAHLGAGRSIRFRRVGQHGRQHPARRRQLSAEPAGRQRQLVHRRQRRPGHVNNGPYNDHPTTYAINGGYRWKVGQDLGLGVDAGYNDLGNFKVKNAFKSNDVNLTSQRNALRGWTAGVNGKINVWQGLYISGRAGVYGWKGHGYSNQDINRHDLDKVSYYSGAGVGYDFSDHFGLGLSYEYFHAKKDHIDLSTDTASLTAEYRF